MNHHREGSGPALVLIHGIGHHWQGWRPVIDRLAPEFDVIACDSPGFGRSAPLPAGVQPTVHSYADAFERFFAELGLDRPHVAGNSMGGGIGLELARRGAARSVTAISPVGFWTARERRYCQLSLSTLATAPAAVRPLVKALAGTVPGRVALFAQLFAHPERIPADEAVSMLDDAWAAPAFAGALAAFDHYRFTDPEQLRGAEVTVAWGRKDRLLLFGRQAPRARAALPWARHVTLGGGHTPFFDDPAAVAEVIRSTALAAQDP